MTNSTQISFRVDEKLHTQAKEILTPKGGISKYLKEQATRFVKHEISLTPHP